MARSAKSSARNDQDPLLHRLFYELDIIRFGTVREEEEGATGLDKAKSQMVEVFGEDPTVPFVLGEIDADLLAIGDGQLKQTGGIDEPQSAITEGAS